MTEETPAIQPENALSSRKPATPLRALLGSAIAAGFAALLWRLTEAIALQMALTKVVSDNRIVMRMSAAIRTLVIGLSAMATGIFAVAALGLFLLCIQMLLTPKATSNPPE
jgi:ABC-type uncharacterized transport system permease subunit